MNTEQENKPQQRMLILREVALLADKPTFYNKAEELGKKAAEALTDRKRSQITGLESLANSAFKTSDVFDFIKLRLARQDEWRKSNWGEDLLNFLSRDLREHRKMICKNLIPQIESDSPGGLEIHLLLIREFIRQLAAHYEYACKVQQR
jgi:hypothetical protein